MYKVGKNFEINASSMLCVVDVKNTTKEAVEKLWISRDFATDKQANLARYL